MSLTTFTNEQLVSWIETNVDGAEAAKEAVKNVIQTNGVTGEDVAQFTSYNDFKELGMTAFMARRLFNQLRSTFSRDFNSNNPPPQQQNVQQPGQQQPNQQQQQQSGRQRRQEQARAADLSIEERIRQNNERRANRCNNNNGNSNGNGIGRNNNNNNVQRGNDYRFQVSIFVGNVRKKTHNFFTVQSTVRDLKIEIANNEAGGRAEDVRLTFLARPLVDTNTLQQSGIIDSQCFVTVVVRVHGGASSSGGSGTSTLFANFKKSFKLGLKNFDKSNHNDHEDSKEIDRSNTIMGSSSTSLVWNNDESSIRERIPDWNNKNIQATYEPDCLTYDDNKEELRVKMPCSHVFAPVTIFKWCERIINVYSKSSINCPIPECDKEWKINDIVSGADLNDDEYGSLMRILNHRKLMESGNYKECPYCNGLVDIPDELYMFRVRCGNIECRSKGDFCWICGQKWTGSGLAVCGNSNCHTSKVNDELKIENCGTTTSVTSRSDVQCPKVRACPRCLSIVEYKTACKHMQCWQCKKGFCFICLAVQQDGKWQCKTGDGYDGKCALAPVQVIS